jgi:hypothetical protein
VITAIPIQTGDFIGPSSRIELRGVNFQVFQRKSLQVLTCVEPAHGVGARSSGENLRRASHQGDRWNSARTGSTCQRRKGNEMRIFVALLIVLAVAYFWDVQHNNGKLLDGLRSMGRSMSHSIGR